MESWAQAWHSQSHQGALATALSPTASLCTRRPHLCLASEIWGHSPVVKRRSKNGRDGERERVTGKQDRKTEIRRRPVRQSFIHSFIHLPENETQRQTKTMEGDGQKPVTRCSVYYVSQPSEQDLLMWGPGSCDKDLSQDMQDGTVGLLAQLCTQGSLHLPMPCRQARPPIQQIIPESRRQQGHRQASVRPRFQRPRTGGRDGHITDTHLRPRAGQLPQDLRDGRKGPHYHILGAGKRQGLSPSAKQR